MPRNDAESAERPQRDLGVEDVGEPQPAADPPEVPGEVAHAAASLS